MISRDKIIRLLKDGGHNRAQLASAAGVAYSTLRSYLEPSKPRLPTVDTAIKIARFFGVSTEWLWDDERGWPPPQDQVKEDLSKVDAVVVLEEALRRKRAARDACDRLLTVYQEVKTYYQEVLREYESGERVPSQNVDDRAESLWFRFEDARFLLSLYRKVWADFEERWANIPLVDVNEDGIDLAEEMFDVSRTVRHDGPETEVMDRVRNLLRSWANTSVSESALGDTARDLLMSLNSSLASNAPEYARRRKNASDSPQHT